MAEEKLKKLLSRLRAQAADPAAALAAPGPDCLSDDEIGTFAAAEGAGITGAARLLKHVAGCPRCSALLSMMLDPAPPADWAIAATQGATDRWLARQPAVARSTVMDIIMAWLPGLAPPEPQLVASYASRVEPMVLEVAPGESAVCLRLGTSEAPAIGAQIELVDAASDEVVARGTTDDEAVVRFEDVEPGTYSLRVEDYAGPLKQAAPPQ